MSARRQRIHLVTDSAAPSGVGEHMLSLARMLRDTDDVVIGARRDSGLIDRGIAAGLPARAIDPDDGADLRRWFARSLPDVVHVHAGIGWEGHTIAEAAREVGIGAVVRTEHLPYLLTDRDQRDEHAFGIGAVDRLICVSQAVADSYRAAIKDAPIVAIANGVEWREPTRSRDSLRAEWGLGTSPVLLMAARFSTQKGHALLLDALPAVIAAHQGCVVLLAGEGELMWDMARAISVRGLAGSVRMLGNRRDMRDLMEAADLLVLPSSFEGLPLAALEAMAAGLPVVATDAPGNAEMIEHGVSGWLSPPHAEALAATILDALSNAPRLDAVAAAASDRQRRLFDAKRMGAETKAVYASVASANDTESRQAMTRIGFIGAGGIAHRHFGVLDAFDDVEVVAICDVDGDRAIEAAMRFGARSFTDFDAMLDAVELDAVYICVPPFAHGDPERAVIRRGLPFFVEKPVSLDIGTAEEILARVEAAGLVTAVGYHWRYLDTVDEVRRLLQTRPPRLMSGYWLDSTPPPRWWWHADQSGGQMIEQTTHLLDLARYLAGNVERAYGLAGHSDRAEFPGLDVPTVSSASLLFESGTIANFASTCLLGWSHRVGLHVFGEGLAIEITDHDLMIDVGAGRPVRAAEGDPVQREDRDFIDAVQGKENRIRCPYSEAVATHRLALAVVESARSGEPVAVGAAQRETVDA